MKDNINEVRLEGYVFQHSLEVKTVKNETSANYGKEFIGGELEVAVDEEGLNVIPVHFSYVTATTAKGKENFTYNTLKKIISQPDKTWIQGGKENALKVRISTTVAVNDFYTQDNQLVSSMRAEGGFVTIVKELSSEMKERNKFKFDMVINKVTHIEADPEKNIENDYVKIKGATFNFRKEMIPIELSVKNPGGMDYFEGLDISTSNLVYTCVWGMINNRTIKISKVTESAWGEAEVQTSERKSREWTVTGTSVTPYEFGEEGVMTVEELKTAMQNREVYLAEVKKRSDDYRANKKSSGSSSANFTPTSTDFDF